MTPAALSSIMPSIGRTLSGRSNLSQFDYDYDVAGQITSWTRTFDQQAASLYKFQYDRSDRLTDARLTDARLTGSATARLGYTYDRADNQTGEEIGGTPRKGTYNTLNQLQSLDAGGAMLIEGTLTEPGKVDVTVTGKTEPAPVDANNRFRTQRDVIPGNNSFTVAARDFANNASSKTFTKNVASGATDAFTYDANGNMLSSTMPSIGRTLSNLKWDAENRLKEVTVSGVTYAFTYDGNGRRTQIADGTTTKRFVWDGLRIAEERDAANAVTKRFFALGEQRGSTAYFYTRDHLGSVREVVDSWGTIQTRLDYDPYGRVTQLSGTFQPDFRFTGHYYHGPTKLHLAPYRAYDAEIGRWISRDPISELGGLNLYAYVFGNPISLRDPLGLDALGGWGGALSGATAGALTGAAAGSVLGGPAGALGGAVAGALTGAVAGALAGSSSIGLGAGAEAGLWPGLIAGGLAGLGVGLVVRANNLANAAKAAEAARIRDALAKAARRPPGSSNPWGGWPGLFWDPLFPPLCEEPGNGPEPETPPDID